MLSGAEADTLAMMTARRRLTLPYDEPCTFTMVLAAVCYKYAEVFDVPDESLSRHTQRQPATR